jgi:hypothetical protein
MLYCSKGDPEKIVAKMVYKDRFGVEWFIRTAYRHNELSYVTASKIDSLILTLELTDAVNDK